MSSRSRLWCTLLAGLAAGVCLSMTGTVMAEKHATPAPGNAQTAVSWEDARLLAEILQRVRENYVSPVDDRTLMQQAAHGLVEGLDDYSSFLDPDEYQELKTSTSGAYAGIGIEVEAGKDSINVVRCIPDSPAEHAGLLAGDAIVSIDGTAVVPGNFDAAIAEMRGEPDTKVRLAVRRVGKPLEFEVLRSRVELASVAAESLSPGFGYLRISSFTDTTASEFESALVRLRADKQVPLKGLVIDLRDNPGGVLDAAVAVADDLLDSGRIVSADGRTPESRFVSEAKPGDLSDGATLTVLVNGGSASAAEILAAALHDNHRATLIGRKTYGKGSVQTIMPLSGGRALKLTTSHYFTPDGISIDRRGIIPDVAIDGTEQPAAELDAAGAPPTLATRDMAVGLALQTLRGYVRVASGTSSVQPRS
jgi:carboxyl-terminal processing protease